MRVPPGERKPFEGELGTVHVAVVGATTTGMEYLATPEGREDCAAFGHTPEEAVKNAEAEMRRRG